MDERDKPLILVVDDEDSNLRLMKAILTAWNYRVELAVNGLEALAKTRALEPEIVLLDVMLPDIDGFEVATRLKSDPDLAGIPVVMVTALTSKEDRVKALEAGADDFLSKPVDRAELQARVRSLIQVRAYHRHMKEYQTRLESEVARKTRELKEYIEKLRIAYLDTIHRLSRAAEYRDQETYQHIVRMGYLSAAIARQLGFSEEDVDTMLCAAPMHDVGKIGIPDRILLKPGKLTEAERKLMEEHTIIGGRILEKPLNPYTEWARVIALTHHERWDGTGYPRRLEGENIPLIGRIVAVADVFDALTSRRPYKEPFPLDVSFDIVKGARGSHFDPRVVDAFLEIKDEVVRIKEQFSDDDESRLYQMVSLASLSEQTGDGETAGAREGRDADQARKDNGTNGTSVHGPSAQP